MREGFIAFLFVAQLLLMAPLIHIYQLESYQAPGYIRSVKQNVRAIYRPLLLSWALPMAAVVLTDFWGLSPLICMLVPALTALIVFLSTHMALRKQPAKKPLAYTARIRRLFAVLALLELALAALVVFGLKGLTLRWQQTIALTVGVMGLPLWVLVGGLAALPMENAFKGWYYRDAVRRLKERPDIIKIGITGSYGKTSCKMILGTLLGEKYNTLITPSSYNTPMGVTRVIRGQLTEATEVFVAEMGARHVGDIKEMCRLVNPTFGLITSIGPQHLETFHTLERVASTKYELVEALPPDGMAFFPADNEICLAQYEKTHHVPARLFGFKGDNLAMTARNIALGPQGCSFTLVNGQGEERLCTTQLLGKHNIQNILGCAAVAERLGLTMDEIASGIAKIRPVEHRLQIVPTTNGVTVIDDAFNSNPAGARAALEVIDTFPGRRIVVTPGLVELGEKEQEENIAFGRAMAAVATFAVLVARNAPDIRQGLVEEGFNEENIIITKTLAQATAALAHLTQAGDVVIFENDLPDHYEL